MTKHTKKILLLGFARDVVSEIRPFFPTVHIKAIYPFFSDLELSAALADVESVFIGNDPDFYLKIIGDGGSDYHITYGSDIIKYSGAPQLNLHKVWNHFRGKKTFVFSLPRELHLGSLYEIGRKTDNPVKKSKGGDVEITLKDEQRKYLAGFIFAQLFSFLPETFTHGAAIQRTAAPNAHNELCNELVETLKGLLAKTGEKLEKAQKKIDPNGDNFDPDDIDLDGVSASDWNIDDLTALLSCTTAFSEEARIKIFEVYKNFSIQTVNGVEELKLKKEDPLKKIYPDRIDYHLYRWLERISTRGFERPGMHPEYYLDSGDKSVRRICFERSIEAFLLPPPESIEDILLPMGAVLDAQTAVNASELKGLYCSSSKKDFPFIGGSYAMDMLYSQILPVLKDKGGHVLIIGDVGTGKELVAQLILTLQGETKNSINCSHLSVELAHSSMFGHLEGAFTGADKDKDGFIKPGGKGSLFMDEIQALPDGVMPMLLRYLENGEFIKLGNDCVSKANTRIIGASNDDAMLHGKFVSCGFLSRFRYVIRVPPLKYRQGDIPLLVEHFTKKACKDLGLPDVELSAEQTDYFKDMDWTHSNVRGLKNAVYNLVVRNAVDVKLPIKVLKQRGRHKLFSNTEMEKILNSSKDSEALRKKLKGHYATNAAIRQRLNSKELKELKELKEIFDEKFADTYEKTLDSEAKGTSSK